MEEDIIEIYVDENGDLYVYIPASAQTFKLEYGEELDKLPKNARFVVQINLSEQE